MINAERVLEAERHWKELSLAEESFFCQRSHITWLELGDSSTNFFYRMVASRKAINHIHYLLADDGSRIETQEAISNHCVGYFSSLLNDTRDQQTFVQEDIDLLLSYRCSPAEVTELGNRFSAAEIREAFFDLPRNKTSGPDGYSSEFFTACWTIIGPEVTEAVSEFFYFRGASKAVECYYIGLNSKDPKCRVYDGFPTEFLLENAI